MGEPAALDVDAYLADPAAELERLAAAHWYAEGLDLTGRPMPMVLGFEAVRHVLRDRRLSARSFTDDMLVAGLSERTARQLTPLFRRDGDDHRRHRGLLAAAFTPRRVERLRPVAAEVAGRLADGIARAGGGCELVGSFAGPLPPEVFAVLFGLPVEDRDDLGRWAGAVAKAFVPSPTVEELGEVEAAAEELRGYCGQLIATRRRAPGDDLVSHLLAVEIDGEALDDDDIVATVSGFVFAGAETTKHQLVELVLAFAEHPDAWDRVAADDGLVAPAVEEVLRHRPIVPALSRVALEPFEHDGLALERDGRLIVSMATANHDPAHFDQPDTFDVARANAADHVTFGWGPHFCLGAGLARVELQEALRALTARFAAPVVDLDAEGRPVGFGWAEELAVTFPPSRSRRTGG